MWARNQFAVKGPPGLSTAHCATVSQKQPFFEALCYICTLQILCDWSHCIRRASSARCVRSQHGFLRLSWCLEGGKILSLGDRDVWRVVDQEKDRLKNRNKNCCHRWGLRHRFIIYGKTQIEHELPNLKTSELTVSYSRVPLLYWSWPRFHHSALLKRVTRVNSRESPVANDFYFVIHASPIHVHLKTFRFLCHINSSWFVPE